ncbi:phosphotransferase [Lactiplantibacillus daowaiensis]|uniref:Phosphotransferase n=1 Tax=Lactiplantibacillus daowaiensis TaxID=2559918 RepID=A0ABW1RYD3_9LACO|nr:phosphotransferase [Lactiplantibacillus daowaiensis]
MDFFQHQINQWADWQAIMASTTTFEPLIRQIYSSENEPFKTLEPVKSDFAAIFQVGGTSIAVFPPANVATTTRDRYQTERFSLTRVNRLGIAAPTMRHAGFIFDAYQFYYVIYQPVLGVPLTNFKATAKPAVKQTLGRQIGLALLQLNGDVTSFNQAEGTVASDSDLWQVFGTEFVTARQQFLAAHAVTPNQFVHGNLTGDNLIVMTGGQIGVQHFQTAMQAPQATELVPLILDAFAGDADFINGFLAAVGQIDLATDVLLGLLWRTDGSKWVAQLMGTANVTLAALQAKLDTLINGK